MNEIVFEISLLIFLVLMGLITRVLVPYLKAQIAESQYAEVADVIAQVVRAAEQTIKESGKGAIKKEHVIKFMHEYLDSKGIKITEEQLDRFIEAAVYSMKNEVAHAENC